MASYRNQLAALFVEENASIRTEKGTHAGLWLDKGIRDQDRTQTENKSRLIKEVAAIPLPEAYIQFYTRWEQTLTCSGVGRPNKRYATAQGRLIVGLGAESVLETSIALHRTYGVPYIPGSALKGLAASYARQRLGSDWCKESEAYQTAFGHTEDAGYITFFDALYVPGAKPEQPALFPDVLTVHHPAYYRNQGKATPSDWDSPTPIPFLSASGTYLIVLAAPELRPDQQHWITTIFEILGHALKEKGIGAKTSSGYGRMTLEELPRDPEELAMERLLQEITATVHIVSRIDEFYRRWEKFTSREFRTVIANALLEKVRHAKSKKDQTGKAWYIALTTYVEHTGKS